MLFPIDDFPQQDSKRNHYYLYYIDTDTGEKVYYRRETQRDMITYWCLTRKKLGKRHPTRIKTLHHLRKTLAKLKEIWPEIEWKSDNYNNWKENNHGNE